MKSARWRRLPNLFNVDLPREAVDRIAHMIWIFGQAEEKARAAGLNINAFGGRRRIPVKCSVQWWCKVCAGSGTIHYAPTASAFEVAARLRLAHREANANCQAQLEVGEEIREALRRNDL